MKKHLKTLRDLQVVRKVGKHERADTKGVHEGILSRCEAESERLYVELKGQLDHEPRLMPKDLTIPEHLLCPINNTLMLEPVMLQSGKTYEKEVIERYF